MQAAADILTLFPKKSQKPNSAYKCPITSIQVCTESQKLSKFSRVTSGSLKRGCHTFQPLFLKITDFGPCERTMRGGAVIAHKTRLLIACGGRGGREHPPLTYIQSNACRFLFLLFSYLCFAEAASFDKKDLRRSGTTGNSNYEGEKIGYRQLPI